MFGILVRNFMQNSGRYTPIKDDDEPDFPPAPVKKFIGSGEDAMSIQETIARAEEESLC